MLAIFALVLTTVAVVLLNHLNLMKKHQWLRQFQGPRWTFPIIGNALEFVDHPSTYSNSNCNWTIQMMWKDSLVIPRARINFGEIYHRNFLKYGPTWKVWLLDEPTLITADPELVKILTRAHKHLDKHFIYDGAKIILGEYGLITSEGKQWKVDRKLFNQSYKLEYLELSFNQCVSDWPKLENDIQANIGVPVECLPLFRKFFLRVILKSFNFNPSMITEKMLLDLGDVFENVLELAKLRMMKPWTRNSIYWKVFGYQRQLESIHRRIRTYVDPIFKDLESQYRLNRMTGMDAKNEDVKTNRSLGDLVGDPHQPFQWRYDHAMTIVGAGTDTSAVATTMTLFFLALNQDCQKKAQDEIDLLFEERRNGELVFSDVSKFRYLRMCIKETMRLHAPGTLMGRTTSEEIVLEDGRKIPKGASVFVVIPELHRNPETFPNPKKFNPERFNETNSVSIKPYTYIPFSAGPRSCIGQKYSECILTRVLAQILRHFSVKTHQKAEEIKILFEIAGTPYPNVELIFDRRL